MQLDGYSSSYCDFDNYFSRMLSGRKRDASPALSPIRDSLDAVESKLRDLRMTANVVSPPRHKKTVPPTRKSEFVSSSSDLDHDRSRRVQPSTTKKSASSSRRSAPRDLRQDSPLHFEDTRRSNVGDRSAISVDELVNSISRELQRTRADVQHLQSSLVSGTSRDSTPVRESSRRRSQLDSNPNTLSLEQIEALEEEVATLQESLRSSRASAASQSSGKKAVGWSGESTEDMDVGPLAEGSSAAKSSTNAQQPTGVGVRKSKSTEHSRHQSQLDMEEFDERVQAEELGSATANHDDVSMVREQVAKLRSQLTSQESMFYAYKHDKDLEVSQAQEHAARARLQLEEEKRRHMQGLQDMKDLLVERESENARLQSIIDRLNGEVEVLQRSKMDQVSSASQTLEAKTVEFEKRVSTLQRAFDDARTARDDASAKNTVLEQEVLRYRSELESVFSRSRDLETRIDNQKAEFEQAETKLRRAMRQKEMDLLSELDVLKRALQDVEASAQAARREAERSDRESELKLRLAEEAHKRQVDVLKARIDQCDSGTIEMERRLRSAKDRMVELETALDSYRSSEEDLRNVGKSQSAQLADAKVKIESLQRELSDSQNKEKDLKTRLKKLQSEHETAVATFKGRVEDLTQLLDQQRDTVVAAHRAQEDAVRQIQEKASSEMQMAVIRAESLSRQLAETEGRAHDAERQVAELSGQMQRQLLLIEGKESEWSKQISLLKQSIDSERTEWQKRVAQLEEEIASRHREKDVIADENVRLKKEIKGARRDWEKEKLKTDEEFRQLQAEKKDEEDVRTKLEADLIKARKKMDADLRAKLELGTDKQAAVLEAERLRKHVEREKKRREELEKRLHKLEKRLQSSFRESEDFSTEQMAVLEVLRDSLQSERLRREESEERTSQLEDRVRSLSEQLARQSLGSAAVSKENPRLLTDFTSVHSRVDEPAGKSQSSRHVLASMELTDTRNEDSGSVSTTGSPSASVSASDMQSSPDVDPSVHPDKTSVNGSRLFGGSTLTDIYRSSTSSAGPTRSTSPGRGLGQRSRSPLPNDRSSGLTDISVLRRYYDAELAGFRDRVRSLSASRSRNVAASPHRPGRQGDDSIPHLRSPGSVIVTSPPRRDTDRSRKVSEGHPTPPAGRPSTSPPSTVMPGIVNHATSPQRKL